jgi:hypothetical protein
MFTTPHVAPGLADLDGLTPVFCEVGVDPRVSPGLDLPVGSRVKFGSVYLAKAGTAATAWVLARNVRQVLAAAATAVVFSGLNGNADRVYELEARIKRAAGSYYGLITLNGLALDSRWHFADPGGAASYQNDFGQFPNAIGGSDGNLTLLRLRVRCATGLNRIVEYWGGYEVGASPNTGTFRGAALWRDATTNLTSIEVSSNGALGLGVGSEFRLWVPPDAME